MESLTIPGRDRRQLLTLNARPFLWAETSRGSFPPHHLRRPVAYQCLSTAPLPPPAAASPLRNLGNISRTPRTGSERGGRSGPRSPLLTARRESRSFAHRADDSILRSIPELARPWAVGHGPGRSACVVTAARPAEAPGRSGPHYLSMATQVKFASDRILAQAVRDS